LQSKTELSPVPFASLGASTISPTVGKLGISSTGSLNATIKYKYKPHVAVSINITTTISLNDINANRLNIFVVFTYSLNVRFSCGGTARIRFSAHIQLGFNTTTIYSLNNAFDGIAYTVSATDAACRRHVVR
jgi:hypothetical protein